MALLEYQHKANASVRDILENIKRFRAICGRIKRFAASLEVIRVMGKVEAAHLSGSSSDLLGLIDELGNF